MAVIDTPKTIKEMSALMAKAKLGTGGMVGECDQSRCNGCGMFGSGPYQDCRRFAGMRVVECSSWNEISGSLVEIGVMVVVSLINVGVVVVMVRKMTE